MDEETTFNKVQINRVTRFGIDRFGKPVKETTQMFNIRTNSVKEAVDLYQDLLDKFYEAEKNRKNKNE